MCEGKTIVDLSMNDDTVVIRLIDWLLSLYMKYKELNVTVKIYMIYNQLCVLQGGTKAQNGATKCEIKSLMSLKCIKSV